MIARRQSSPRASAGGQAVLMDFCRGCGKTQEQGNRRISLERTRGTRTARTRRRRVYNCLMRSPLQHHLRRRPISFDFGFGETKLYIKIPTVILFKTINKTNRNITSQHSTPLETAFRCSAPGPFGHLHSRASWRFTREVELWRCSWHGGRQRVGGRAWGEEKFWASGRQILVIHTWSASVLLRWFDQWYYLCPS